MAQANRQGMIGVIATILIGAAILTFVINYIFDTLLSVSTSNETNDTINAVRPIATAGIILFAIVAIVVIAAYMMGLIGGSFGGAY
jgi:hypothetical protein